MGYIKVRESIHGNGSAAVFDLLGVGFGPSNMALAVAVAEHRESRQSPVPVTATFLEQKERFAWHSGMLIDDATMQVAFLKDLATLRNPTSRYSFLAYLAAKDRLVDFINQKTFFPTRLEFHDYLEWAAASLTDLVEYSTRVTRVRLVGHEHAGSCLEVAAERTIGETRQSLVRYAHNVVLGTGLVPVMPCGVASSDRVLHSAELLLRMAAVDTDKPYRFVVVGAGQSAAEVVHYLHGRFGNAEVHAVFARYGYSIADDTAFANRVFDPKAVDDYYYAPDSVKQRIMGDHANTNYSVVDADLISDLHGRLYRERVAGRHRLHVHNMSAVAHHEALGDKVRLAIRNLGTGESTTVLADYVVYATGYRPADPAEILGEAAELCQRDSAGRLMVQRDYRVRTLPDVPCGIYLQGSTEHSHGISSSLLSNVAVRAGEILASIDRSRAASAIPRHAVAKALEVVGGSSVRA